MIVHVRMCKWYKVKINYVDLTMKGMLIELSQYSPSPGTQWDPIQRLMIKWWLNASITILELKHLY